MKERPILFSPEMVQAIFDGRKRQTRRIVKFSKVEGFDNHDIWKSVQQALDGSWIFWSTSKVPDLQPYERGGYKCPYGRSGDILWVREKWNAQNMNDQWWHEVPREDRPLWNWAWTNPVRPAYDALPPRWLPSIHMPKDACRLVLEIVGVRVERVQEITPEDAQAEGCFSDKTIEIAGQWSIVTMFKNLWNSINSTKGKRWEDTPWVWVIEFKVL